MNGISFSYCLAVAAGGAMGALARYGIGQWLIALGHPGWMGILAANFLGCALLGTLMGSFSSGSLTEVPYVFGVSHETLKLILMTGFLGALTTFSTFIGDIYWFNHQGQPSMALFYSAISLLGGYGLFYACYRLGQWVVSAT